VHSIDDSFSSILNQFCSCTSSGALLFFVFRIHFSTSSRVGVLTASSSPISLLSVLVTSCLFSFLSLSSFSFSIFNSSLKYSSYRCSTVLSFLPLLFHHLCFYSHYFMVEILSLGYLLPYKISVSHSDI
jgi:hypothetical protein